MNTDAIQRFLENQFSSIATDNDDNHILSSLHFPEPFLIVKQEEYNNRVAQEERKKRLREESEKWQKIDYIQHVAMPRRLQRSQLFQLSSDLLKDLQQELLYGPPVTLLDKLYRKGIDSPLVVYMLDQFERRNGTLVSDLDRDKILPKYDSVATIKASSKSKEQKEEHEIKVHLSSPDLNMLKKVMQQKGIDGLSEALKEINEEKKRRIKELEKKMDREKLMFLLQMRDYQRKLGLKSKI
jgi:hypothetical protein